MRSIFDDRPGQVPARAAAAFALGFGWLLVVHSSADAAPGWHEPAAARDGFVVESPVDEPSGTQLAPGHSHPSNQSEPSREPEGGRKPERRDRVRDGGAEDELRERDRLMLA